jgi:hypothetical protein
VGTKKVRSSSRDDIIDSKGFTIASSPLFRATERTTINNAEHEVERSSHSSSSGTSVASIHIYCLSQSTFMSRLSSFNVSKCSPVVARGEEDQ